MAYLIPFSIKFGIFNWVKNIVWINNRDIYSLI